MQDRFVDILESDRAAHCRDRELHRHTRINRVADDPVRPQVFNRAQIQAALVRLNLSRPVPGDAGHPHLIRTLRGDVALHEIVEDRRASFAVQAAIPRQMRPDPLLGTQPPHTPLRCPNAGLRLDLVRDQPIPKPRLVAMNGEGGLDQVGIISVA